MTLAYLRNSRKMSNIPKILKFNNDLHMPVIGLGTYRADTSEVKEAVKYAIEIGYRHIDTAMVYRNEKQIGEALTEVFDEGKVKREDLFIVTKLWNNFHQKMHVLPQIKQSLELLNLDYVDLYLIHWPFGFKVDADLFPPAGNSSNYSDVDYLETWMAMEDGVKQGLAKSIGVSNFNKEQLDRVLNNCTIRPVVNQFEVNPNISQQDLITFCKDKNIQVAGFCPLERLGVSRDPNYPKPTIQDPKVIEIGKKYNKTPAQVILRYLLEFGIAILPKSTNPSRIKENFEIFDFDLSSADLSYINSLNKNVRVSGMWDYQDHKYHPFKKVDSA